uniref:peptidoglycan DD-metalloendopeptidase family protein n=1 Tax=Gemmiger formicilis TaxID=745368 RepID=UPI004029C5A2
VLVHLDGIRQTPEGSPSFYATLDEAEHEFASSAFLRIHKSYLINGDHADNQIWQLCASQSSGGGSTGDYVWPTKSTRITQSYSSGHTGIDIGAVTAGVEGDPIYAFCSGKVKRVFNWNASQGTSGNASMGNCVFIQSANPKPSNGGSYLRTIYMHMQSAPLVSVGQYVTKGQIIGYMGNTGNSSAAHLHFAMQANSTDMNPETGTDRYVDRDWINPMAYF